MDNPYNIAILAGFKHKFIYFWGYKKYPIVKMCCIFNYNVNIGIWGSMMFYTFWTMSMIDHKTISNWELYLFTGKDHLVTLVQDSGHPQAGDLIHQNQEETLQKENWWETIHANQSNSPVMRGLPLNDQRPSICRCVDSLETLWNILLRKFKRNGSMPEIIKQILPSYLNKQL